MLNGRFIQKLTIMELFDVNSVKFSDFFQEGAGSERYFEGLPYQRGYGRHGSGVGAIFRSLIRYILPVLKRAAPVLKKEGLETGARILNDIAEGENVGEAVVKESKETAKNIARRVLKGEGRRRRRRRVSRKTKSSVRRSVGRRSRKKRRADSLGFY